MHGDIRQRRDLLNGLNSKITDQLALVAQLRAQHEYDCIVNHSRCPDCCQPLDGYQKHCNHKVGCTACKRCFDCEELARKKK